MNRQKLLAMIETLTKNPVKGPQDVGPLLRQHHPGADVDAALELTLGQLASMLMVKDLLAIAASA